MYPFIKIFIIYIFFNQIVNQLIYLYMYQFIKIYIIYKFLNKIIRESLLKTPQNHKSTKNKSKYFFLEKLVSSIITHFCKTY